MSQDFQRGFSNTRPPLGHSFTSDPLMTSYCPKDQFQTPPKVPKILQSLLPTDLAASALDLWAPPPVSFHSPWPWPAVFSAWDVLHLENFYSSLKKPSLLWGLPWSPTDCYSLLWKDLLCTRHIVVIYFHICLYISWNPEAWDRSSFIAVMSTAPSSVPSSSRVLKVSSVSNAYDRDFQTMSLIPKNFRGISMVTTRVVGKLSG